MQTGEAANNPAPQLDLDTLMERIRAEVAERKRASAAAAAPPRGNREKPDFVTREFTAQALLALPAAEFARAVHLAFWGREPTPEEFVRQRDRVLTGQAGRMRILREFRASSTHRESGRKIAGFGRASAWDRIYWSPPAKAGRATGRLVAGIFGAPRRIREYIARIEMLERRAAEAASSVRSLHNAQAADRQEARKQVRQVGEQLAATKEALDRALATRAGALENRLAQQARESSAELAARTNEIRTALVDHWRAILDQKLRTEAFLSSATEQPERDRARGDIAAESAHLLDPLYLSFEDRYRGSRSDIKERQRVYLGRLQACRAETGDGEVIDIGCGRGEWLELLSENGIRARGYDLNRIAVEECRERGLSVELRDAVESLSALPENACSAITAFHVVEHMGFEALVRLLDQSLRVLRPGGLLILETPNPANLVVAAETFYFDPTHRNPLPSELTGYLLKSRGFGGVDILPLHPVAWDAHKEYDDPMLGFLQDKLFGPQDYGAIGRKPS